MPPAALMGSLVCAAATARAIARSAPASVTLVADPKVEWARPDWERTIYHCRKFDRDLTSVWGDFRHFD